MRPLPANSDILRTLVLAALVGVSGCQLALGGDPTSGRIVGSGELTDQVAIQLSPGALRSPGDAPLAWLAVPTADITLTASADPSDTVTLPVANVSPDATVTIRNIRGVTANDDPACNRNNTTDCLQSDDPLCDAGTYTREAPTRGRVEIPTPPCRRITFRLTPQAWTNSDRGATAGVVGQTSSTGPLRTAAERASDAGADFLMLLGDHADAQADHPADRLADRTDDLPVPVIVLPGERELSDESLVDFERLFGPVDLRWRIGGIDFIAPDTSSGGLGREGLSELRSNLRPIGRSSSLIAFTHRPPLDPDGFRNRGFTSRIEGARAVSVLSGFNTDFMVAGHLRTTIRDRLSSIPLQVVSSRSPQRLLMLDAASNNGPTSTRWLDF
jgi:hypothetical protein